MVIIAKLTFLWKDRNISLTFTCIRLLHLTKKTANFGMNYSIASKLHPGTIIRISSINGITN